MTRKVQVGRRDRREKVAICVKVVSKTGRRKHRKMNLIRVNCWGTKEEKKIDYH